MADVQELSVQVARLEAKSEAQHSRLIDTLGRIEAKANEINASVKVQERLIVGHGDRLIKLESDSSWTKKISSVGFGILAVTARRWLKGVLGIH